MPDRALRLSPEARRTQLLDVAAVIVRDDGVAACTVDEVSQRAGVTSQLVHKYFGSRASLLQELFGREDQRFQADIHAKLANADSFDDIVRVFVTANFDQLSSATVIGQLRDLPETATIRKDRQRAGGRSAEHVLVQALTAEHSIPPEAVEFVLRLGSAASIEAGNLAAQRPGRNRDLDIENAVRFILAGIRELVDND